MDGRTDMSSLDTNSVDVCVGFVVARVDEKSRRSCRAEHTQSIPVLHKQLQHITSYNASGSSPHFTVQVCALLSLSIIFSSSSRTQSSVIFVCVFFFLYRHALPQNKKSGTSRGEERFFMSQIDVVSNPTTWLSKKHVQAMKVKGGRER
jgi:hypothetical protein